jgi:hypothetical protein
MPCGNKVYAFSTQAFFIGENMKLKVEKKNAIVVWNVNAKCRHVVKPIADEFGMSVEQFLQRYTEGRLPAQIPQRGTVDEFEYDARTTWEFKCSDPDLVKRIERTAAFRQVSLPAMIADAIMGYVECFEDDMIISPKTGAAFADDRVLELFKSYQLYREQSA